LPKWLERLVICCQSLEGEAALVSDLAKKPKPATDRANLCLGDDEKLHRVHSAARIVSGEEFLFNESTGCLEPVRLARLCQRLLVSDG
jgi:hypothetical protein